ncbi:hypothetical protein D910_12591, partial [Dendroctonus ponderosae]
MFLKSCVLYYIVCGGVIFAELPQDTRNLQDDENLEGYLPSGWKPSGPAFKIPESPQTGTEVQVDLTYSIPKETLAAPPNQPPVTYGPPQEEVTTAVPSPTEELTTTVLPTTTEIIFEDFSNDTLNNDEGKQKENLLEETKDAGARVYYIYHPTGLLQKVSYRTKDDQANMAYSAELKYENVEPIRSPVYTYDPETYAFKRL